MDPGPVVHALAQRRGTGPDPAPRSEAISVHNGFSFVKKKKLFVGYHCSVKVLYSPRTISFFFFPPTTGIM